MWGMRSTASIIAHNHSSEEVQRSLHDYNSSNNLQSHTQSISLLRKMEIIIEVLFIQPHEIMYF